MPEKVLIVRMSAIGDIVMSSCLAEGIKQRYPDAKVSWLVQSGMQGLLEANPFVDEVVVWHRDQWQTLRKQKKLWALFKTVRQFRRELKQRNFTIAVDAQGLMKSGLMVWWSGAKQRIGLDSREGSSRLMTQVVYSPNSDDMGSEYRYLLRTLGIEPLPNMRVTVKQDDMLSAQHKVAEILDNKGFFVFCPFSSRLNKNWVDGEWAKLADSLYSQFGLKSLMLGGPDEKIQAGHIAAQSAYLYSLTGQTSLTEAAAIIERSEAVVGVDTGLTHMGVINNIPTVVLFGATCPYLHTDSSLVKILYHGDKTAPKDKKNSDNFMMRKISSEEVVSHLTKLVEK